MLVTPKLSPNSESLDSFGDSFPGLKVLLLNARVVKGKVPAIQDLILNDLFYGE